MEHTIKKVTEISINIEDGFYALEYTPNEGVRAYCSVKGDQSMLIRTIMPSIDFTYTKVVAENYHMVKQPDNKTFMEALTKVSDQIEKFI